MAVHVSDNFGDLLDIRFQRIFHEQYEQLPDMIGRFFTMEADNGREDMRWSSVGAFQDWGEFSGSVDYDTIYQGYDTTATHVEFASGFQVERKLYDDTQYGVMDQRPVGLATSAARTRQTHGARIFNNAFSVDTYFYNNSEGVALCSNSHTTTSGASTSTGFDNLVTDALSTTAVIAARIQMRKFRDDRGNRFSVMPNEILIPVDLFDVAQEINESMGKPDVSENNINVNRGKFDIVEWEYLSDTNNWFMMDSRYRTMMLHWVDRFGPTPEFAYAEDLDTIVAKWRGYMRYCNGWDNWRFILGASVS